jgi:hypothetical protein
MEVSLTEYKALKLTSRLRRKEREEKLVILLHI